MNKVFFCLFLLFSINCLSQQYDKLYIEKSKIDKNNIIYIIGNKFIYDVKLIIEDNLKYINKEDKDSLTSDHVKAMKEFQLHVEKPKFLGRTNKNQTEIKYSDYPISTFITSTGLVENKNNIWFHPPRFGFLRALETCPFPYIKLNEKVGYEWNDEMVISNYWSDERWGVWKDKLLLKYKYIILGQEMIETKFGRLNTTKIYATASSDIGISSLVSYFNEKYGFIKLQYTLFNDDKVILELKDIK